MRGVVINTQASGAVLMVMAVVCFGVTHACVKALTGIPFYEVVFFRAIISLFLCVYSLRRLKISFWGNNKKILFLRGFAGTLALTCYFFTLQDLPLATAVTIQYLSPLITILISHYWLKEAAKPIQWLFFISAFVGVFVIQGYDSSAAPFSVGIGILAAIGSAFAYNCVRKLKDSEHELVIILYFPMITAPFISPFVISNFVMPSNWQWLGLLAVGIFTQLAQVFMTRAYQREPAANISIYNYLGIFIAIGVGYLIFGESLSTASLVGILIIFLSVVASSLVRMKAKAALQVGN